MGAHQRVDEQEGDAVDQTSEKATIGTAPAVAVLKAAHERPDRSEYGDHPVGRGRGAEQDSGQSPDHRRQDSTKDDLRWAGPVAEQLWLVHRPPFDLIHPPSTLSELRATFMTLQQRNQSVHKIALVSEQPIQTPMRMSGKQRREQLLDVTAEIVCEQGFQAASIQSVARRAGISRPIVYEHFGDLGGLLRALIGREMEQALVQVSESALADLTEGDPVELMIESLRTYLTAVEQHPATWRLVLMPPEGAPEILRRSIIRGRNGVLERLIQSVAPGLKPGRPTPDPELTARTLSAIGESYARLILTDPSSYSIERLLAHARWFLNPSM